MTTARAKSKILTLAEIKDRIGAHGLREQSVCMVHGTFDVVHPGHLRHLFYAKSKADVLIASVTADRHVQKGAGRPHVPQELRALNLAAFEMVDFVMVDDAETPLASIRELQPNYFAKGFEYGGFGTGRTKEEQDAVSAYGGSIIFTPGDVIYSSSRLLELAKPDLRQEKLRLTLEAHGLTMKGLESMVIGCADQSVQVVGDLIVDTITSGTVIGGPVKTPTISIHRQRSDDFVGGAGVVARHLRAAGAKVRFSTVIGDDALGNWAMGQIQRDDIRCDYIIDRSRPTTRKEAIVADGYRLLKVDTLDNRALSDDFCAMLAGSIAAAKVDVTVFSDFRHGIFTKRSIAMLAEQIRSPYRVADSQVASRWGNIAEFKGFDLITPNEREARFALGDQDSGVRTLASALYQEAGCGTLILKMGEAGVLCASGEFSPGAAEDLDKFIALDSFTGDVIDPVGAGDALLAYAALIMGKFRNPAAAAIIGSIAAALECEREGNIPVTQGEVIERLRTLERADG